MTAGSRLARLAFGLTLALAATSALAQTSTSLIPSSASPPAGNHSRLVQGSLSGDETATYPVTANAGQILAVDLDSANASVNFNVISASDGHFLFAGMAKGSVADIPVPADGEYQVQVFLVRAAARRDESASYSLRIETRPADRSAGASDDPDFWQVSLDDAEGHLNVRAGPGARYTVTTTLDNGAVLANRGCRPSGGTRWCQIRENGSGVRGWVAGDFLVESHAPASPPTPADLQGNGTPFDATGELECTLTPGKPTQQCPYGVVREGYGNAGIWIGLPSRQELHVLFESGMVVAVGQGNDYVARKIEDRYEIDSEQRHFVIPERAVRGE
ncbi:SH3 domain-containing protein [Salinicola rhizosphaerae]|uniref:SH3b domain-containing protein n=1 Tax=Salinicola rhizosphaerae TaxID=1443141 RepID=A0ABQ3DPI3_9GAMM|nr:SH3 domain-containing protein [Salinicola rhizosphaerae]GHB07387.1 hypothetical protein GCM10009038_00720 [Salinicola rhizosphaerae]